jgi:hypothetical protein
MSIAEILWQWIRKRSKYAFACQQRGDRSVASEANCESTRAALANARRAKRINDELDDDDDDDDDDDADDNDDDDEDEDDDIDGVPDSWPSRLRTLRHAAFSAVADNSSDARAPIASHAVANSAVSLSVLSAQPMWSIEDDIDDDDPDDVKLSATAAWSRGAKLLSDTMTVASESTVYETQWNKCR